MLKRLGKTLLLLLITLLATVIFSNVSNADSSLDLKNLDFQVTVNSDGSMEVTETWDIRIYDTNTLYKDFILDKNKYSSISDVKVREITDGIEKEFTQINKEMYHVTKDCYYGLQIKKNKFEIAWGVGLDNKSDTREYEISYTVNDAIGKYNDYAELYWQFVGEDFEVDADEITGTIILPEAAANKEDVKVWGHTEGLNGEIYVTANNKIKFELSNFRAGRYVEVRSLFPTNMIKTSGRTYNSSRYDEVVKEETKWANAANARRMWEENKEDIFRLLYILAAIAICIWLITKIVKYSKKLATLNKFKPEQELEYFRDLPEIDVTPGEALYLLEEPYSIFDSKFGNIFSATLLDLDLKKFIELRVEKDEKGKDKIYIKRLKPANPALKEDEAGILNFVNKVEKEKDEIELKELEKYIKKHSTSVQLLISQTKREIETQLAKEGCFNKQEKEEHTKYKNMAATYFALTIAALFWIFPVAIVLLINGIMCSKIKNRINVLTQKGIDEKEKWKGMKKYMEDFSLLDEKEVPALEVWEKYLVYATAFGIADKVLKQLKTIYPNIDELDNFHTSTYMYFMYHSNFSTSFNSAINSSISSAYSSGSGGGGGFSGGGGGGRWPAEVAAADSAVTKIEKNILFICI